jgi:imidazolonepropionase-like amidohydrolase
MKREGTVEPVDRIRVSVGSPEEARDAVTRLADGGADFLKVRTVADEATLRAIATAARSRGLRLTGHPVASPDVLVEIGIGSVEHALAFSPLDIPLPQRRALFERMRAAGVRMGTTTVNLEQSVLMPYDTAVAQLKADPLQRYVGEYLAADWIEQVEEKKGPEAARALEDFARALPNFYRDLREMHAAGVEFLAGSDAAVVFMHPGFSLHGELASLVHHVGLTTAEALRAATISPARFFGLERELGAVRPGYRADLLLLESNPLNDIRATRRIVGVMQDGHWLDRHDLDALLEAAVSEVRGLKHPK